MNILEAVFLLSPLVSGEKIVPTNRFLPCHKKIAPIVALQWVLLKQMIHVSHRLLKLKVKENRENSRGNFLIPNFGGEIFKKRKENQGDFEDFQRLSEKKKRMI